MKQLVSVISVILLIAGSLAHAEAKKSVRIALPSWEGGQFIAYDLGKTIKEVLDIPIEYVSLEGDLMWVELDKDDGRIDVFPDLWMPNQEKNWKEFITERKIGHPHLPCKIVVFCFVSGFLPSQVRIFA